jgi:hypothetical protein
MNTANATKHFIISQQLVIQAQQMALKMPELGINVDALAYQPLDELTGIIAFLKRRYAEKES